MKRAIAATLFGFATGGWALLWGYFDAREAAR